MISGILLAGGKSSRMGRNKVFLPYHGKELYRYPLDVLTELCDEIIVSGPAGLFPEDFPYRIVPDIIPGMGPAGGIYSCLKIIKNTRAVVLSCDIPFITSEYIKALISAGREDTIVVGTDGTARPQPLAGLYPVSLLPVLERQLELGNVKMARLLDMTQALLLDVSKLGFNPDRLFFNVNNRDDFDALEKMEEL